MSSAETTDGCVPAPPMRATESVRLELTKLSIESGVSWNQIVCRICESTANVLGIARVGIWVLINDRQALQCIQLFERETSSWSEGTLLQVADFPEYFGHLSSRKIVPAEAALTDPKTSELVDSYLRPLGITSMLDAPIYIAGEVVGVLCCEHIGPQREWTTEERDFVASIADLIAIKYRATQVKKLKKSIETRDSRLVALEKSDALAKMAMGVAHDFRNILVSISNSLFVIQSAGEADQKQAISVIERACESGEKLITELIEYGRSSKTRPEALSPALVIDQFLPVMKTAVGSGYELCIEHASETGKVLIDRNQFNRVLLNLVMNARDASSPGSPIEIRTHLNEQDEEAAGNFITVEVCDHGTGMDEATQQHLFEPFYSTKEDGTGLGLAIVQRIIDRAGGFIRVDSQPGVGTKISVHLPRVSVSD